MRNVIKILAALTVAFLVYSCSMDRVKDIKLKSCSIESVALTGLRSAGGTLLLEIDNPAMQFTLSDLQGTLYYNGEELATYTAEPVTIKGKSTESYPVQCEATLSPSVSLARLMSLAGGIDMEQLTTDIQAKATLKKGLSKTLTYKGLPLKKLLDKAKGAGTELSI